MFGPIILSQTGPSPDYAALAGGWRLAEEDSRREAEAEKARLDEVKDEAAVARIIEEGCGLKKDAETETNALHTSKQPETIEAYDLPKAGVKMNACGFSSIKSIFT